MHHLARLVSLEPDGCAVANLGRDQQTPAMTAKCDRLGLVGRQGARVTRRDATRTEACERTGLRRDATIRSQTGQGVARHTSRADLGGSPEGMQHRRTTGVNEGFSEEMHHHRTRPDGSPRGCNDPIESRAGRSTPHVPGRTRRFTRRDATPANDGCERGVPRRECNTIDHDRTGLRRDATTDH